MQVTASVGGRLVMNALGATARPRPDGLDGRFVDMPAVVGPARSLLLHRGSRAVRGYQHLVEFREAVLPDPTGNRMALWARLSTREDAGLTRAGLAFLADMVPVAVARAAGRQGAGFLDNALRFGEIPPTDWVLLELRGDLSTHGYGHGSMTAWSADGALIATGSQTANMRAITVPATGARSGPSASGGPAPRSD